jgi:lipopolysaccharide export system permease protein
MALPFLCFAFALCSPALSFRFAKTGSFMGIFLSIVMVFVAWNTLLLTKALGLSGYLSPFLSAWAPDILFAAVGVVLLWRSE